uniref:L1 transposable element RRM domain-containing protein n=1 Tax=Cyprinus carpio TaxID=7962 RepID=A0A8C2GYB9_CYPCA
MIANSTMEQSALIYASTTIEQSASNKFLLDALQQLKSEMVSHFDVKMDNLQMNLDTIKLSLSNLGEHISELEQRVSGNEDNISDLGKRIKTLESENAYLRDKVDDAENRNRVYNLHFIHVPEESEGKDICGFISSLIQQLFGKESFTTPPAIERAHRSPMHRTKDSARPRVILVKCLSLLDRHKILQLAWEKKQLEYNGDRIHIFPDFSAALLSKRRQFDDIKKQLQQRKLEYTLIYPATLRIIFNGKPLLFKTPAEANNFLQVATYVSTSLSSELIIASESPMHF